MAACAPIYCPAVPFQSAILGGITEGKRVTIQGQVHKYAKRFAINLICFNNDIAFHFNPRFDEGNVIVCNTMQMKTWGSEERKHTMPFQRKTYFDLTILVSGHAFQVVVNGQHILEYRHRVSYQTIQSLEVTGDLSLSFVNFSPSVEMSPAPPPYTPGYVQNAFSPPMYIAPMPQKAPITLYTPVMPFQAALQSNFDKHGKVILMGHIYHGADRFHVNLLNSRSRNIHLHVNPRFREGVLVRNTQNRGSWGPEERQTLFMPFHPGQNFQVKTTNIKFKGDVHDKKNMTVFFQKAVPAMCHGQVWHFLEESRYVFDLGPTIVSIDTSKSSFMFILNIIHCQMEIINEGGFFGVYSNGAKLFNYVHRLPFNQIDMIEVDGDVTLTFVQF